MMEKLISCEKLRIKEWIQIEKQIKRLTETETFKRNTKKLKTHIKLAVFTGNNCRTAEINKRKKDCT